MTGLLLLVTAVVVVVAVVAYQTRWTPDDVDDLVDEAINRYLDYLEALDHLDGDDRRLVEDLAASIHAGRGIDPYAQRPSLDGLLADLEFRAAAAAGMFDVPLEELGRLRERDL